MALRKTSLNEIHIASGGRMVPFGGWDMPVQYSSILNEARAVRTSAGIFDVSHMGRIEIQGPDASLFLNRVLSSNIPKLAIGRAKYGVICNESGGIIDDAIIYRLGEDRYLLIPNAGNSEKVQAWLSKWHMKSDVIKIKVLTDEVSMVALQGPQSEKILSELCNYSLSTIKLFRAIETKVLNVEGVIARTGYTGEDGFEIMVPSKNVGETWNSLVSNGAVPCGLGARDVLRLEAGLPLHGNDIDTNTHPYEACLGKFVDPDRDGYVAGPALSKLRDGKLTRKLVGFNMIGRGIARQGHSISYNQESVGTVTSGSISPILDRAIGMGYVREDVSGDGTILQIDVRGRLIDAEITPLPFYKRS